MDIQEAHIQQIISYAHSYPESTVRCQMLMLQRSLALITELEQENVKRNQAKIDLDLDQATIHWFRMCEIFDELMEARHLVCKAFPEFRKGPIYRMMRFYYKNKD